MKRAVFVDTDVVLDLLSRRDPFYPHAARLFSQAERGMIKACVSSLSFANLFYNLIVRDRLTYHGWAILIGFTFLLPPRSSLQT